jgi:hopene-associated glycosyltransferase HpnB
LLTKLRVIQKIFDLRCDPQNEDRCVWTPCFKAQGCVEFRRNSKLKYTVMGHLLHSLLAISIASLSLLVWTILLFARGWFWISRFLGACSGPRQLPPVAVVIPARDEADCIGQAIASLCDQKYAGKIDIVLVDDHSSDATCDQAFTSAAQFGHNQIRVISAPPVPAGWKGKTWALQEGVPAASETRPAYYLFTDADIVHDAHSVHSLIACAESYKLDLVSCMVKLHCKSFPERALIPAFTFFFFMLYPPRWVSNERRKTAAAAGGCVLIRASSLQKIGGIAAIHQELIDDCALAAEVKRSGGRVWLGLNASTYSMRSYRGFSDVYQLIARAAYSQLNHSALLLIGTVLGMALTYLAPPAMVFAGGYAALCGGTAWLMMSVAYWPTLRFYQRSPLWAPLLPLVTLFYLAATVQSAVDYWRGMGGRWKGRIQDPLQSEISLSGKSSR